MVELFPKIESVILRFGGQLPSSIPTISKVCELYVDLRLSPDVVDHPRSHIYIHGFYELSFRPLCMILGVDAAEEG